MRHAHALQRLLHAPLALGRGHAGAIGQRQLDVLDTVRSPMRLKLWKMKPISWLRMRERSAKSRFATGWPFSLYCAAGWRVEQADDGQQRRFAAARRAGHGDVFALAQCQMHAGERVRFNLVGIEDLGEPFDVDQIVCGMCVSPCIGVLRAVYAASIAYSGELSWNPSGTCRKG